VSIHNYLGGNIIINFSYSDQKHLLLCYVIVGKAFKMNNVITGCELTKGYDSHISPNGQEVVIFNTDLIIPCYKITFQ
jgi:hypothetical protein